MSSRYSRERFRIARLLRKRSGPMPSRELAIEEHVVVHGQTRHEREVLEDGVDAERARVRHRLELHLLAVDEDPAGVGLVKAGQDLDQGRFPGAVVADQTEHLAVPETERDVLERRHDAEALADVLDPDRIGRRARGARRPARSPLSLTPPSRADPTGESAPA